MDSRAFKANIVKLKENLLSITLFFGIILSFVWPDPGLVLKDYIKYFLIITTFLSCLNINFKDFKVLKNYWWKLLILLSLIYLVPTFLIFIFGNLFGIKEFDLVGLVLIAAIPCGISVVFISDILKGNSSVSLTATTLAYLICPLVTPFLVQLFSHSTVEISFADMSILIIEIILIPFVLAQIVKHTFLLKPLSKIKNSTNTILLLLMFWGIVAPTIGTMFADTSATIILILISIIVLLITWFLAAILGKSTQEKATYPTVALFKNFTLAYVVALSLNRPEILLGVTIYGIISNISIIPIQIFNNRKI